MLADEERVIFNPITFESFAEILEIDNFDLDAPVTADNFEHIYGFYDLPNKHEEVRCQFEHCGTGHRKGWVVQLATGTRSNIGWMCAQREFQGIEEFIDQRRAFMKEKRLDQYIERISILTTDREASISNIHRTLEELTVVREFARNLRDRLPRTVHWRLVDMAKTHNSSVDIQIGHEEKQDNGPPKIKWLNQSLGSIVGFTIWSTEGVRKLIPEGKQLISTLNEATPGREAGERKLRDWAQTLDGLDDYHRRAADMVADYHSFRGEKNLLLLCFLCRDHKERDQVGKTVLDYSQSRLSSDQAPRTGKALVSALDKDVRIQFGQYFRIP